MAGRKQREALEERILSMSGDLRAAAEETVALRLIVLALLRRQDPPMVTIMREEFARVLATKGCSLERVTDPVSGQMIVRLAMPDEDDLRVEGAPEAPRFH